MPFALHQEVLRPSGVEFAVSLDLVAPLTASSSSDIQVLGNLVVARSNVLKVFEIRRQYASLRADLKTHSESYSAMRGDGVEKGGAMETIGDDFVNVGEFKVIAGKEFERASCCYCGPHARHHH
jgi:cleavage and polyadenylation specificity factor subunit 1